MNLSPHLEEGTFDNRANGNESLRVTRALNGGGSGDLNLDDEKNILHRRSVDKENAADQVVSSPNKEETGEDSQVPVVVRPPNLNTM